MFRDVRLYVDDILDAIASIQMYVNQMDYDAFTSDRKTIDAVIRNLEIIGEAARALPEEVVEVSPDIEWRKIIGLRNLLIHEYFSVNETIIWDIIQNKLTPLDTACRKIMAKLDQM